MSVSANAAPASAAEREELRTTGFFIREQFFTEEEMRILEPLADEAADFRNSNFERYDDIFRKISTREGFVFVNELADDSPVREKIQAFCLRPAIRDMARALGGENVAHCCYQLVYKYPGHDRPMAWHQDEIQTPADPPFFNMWVAFDDMEPENGCLWALPGVGLDRVVPHQDTEFGRCGWPLDDPNQGVPLRMRRGDVCLMGSKTLHKSGGNTSDRMRRAMLIIFMDRDTQIRGHTVPTVAYA
jgi:ectoine hydroxylase-related dioxygenase (phytanoyl-CoA dioxygenase family)